MKGLIVSVYRDARDKDVSASPIQSNHVREYTVIDDEIEGPFEPKSDRPVIRLVRRDVAGPYIHAVPDGLVGEATCFGGNFIWTSDSRFRKVCKYPVPIHDMVLF